VGFTLKEALEAARSRRINKAPEAPNPKKEKPMPSPTSAEITKAITVVQPIAESLVATAEKSEASGPVKHQAVASGLEMVYRALQKSIKELRNIPWEVIEPYLVPVGSGLISAIVTMANSLFGKMWGKLADLFNGDDND